MSNDGIRELWLQHRAGQDKYTYFLLAVTASAIVFAVQKTMSARTASRGQATVAKSERIRATLNQRPYDLALDRGGVPARRFAPFA